MRVCVLYGGESPEGLGSHTSAYPAADALRRFGHQVETIDLLEVGWQDRVAAFDIAYIAGHGWYAEDGKLQGLLEIIGLAYTGPGVLASAIGMHKATFKTLLRGAGIATLPSATLTTGMSDEEVAGELAGLSLPVFVKPVSGGDSISAGIAESVDDVLGLLRAPAEFAVTEFIVEPYVGGSTYTVGIVAEHDGRLRPLPVLEAISKNRFYDNEAKNDPSLTEYRCPAPLPQHLVDAMHDTALRVFRLVQGRDVGRVDFLVSDGVPYVLEVNTSPGLAPTGNLATAAAAGGIKYDDLISRILQSATVRPLTYAP